MAQANTAQRVLALARPIAERLGLEIWDVRFVKEGASWQLQIFIDKSGGVSIDDCETLSKEIDTILDEEDFIPQSYYLVVSSPGLGRKLTQDSHFEKMRGERVRVRLIRPQNGRRELKGTLLDSRAGGSFLLKTEEDEMEIQRKETAFVRLLDDEDIGGLLQ